MFGVTRRQRLAITKNTDDVLRLIAILRVNTENVTGVLVSFPRRQKPKAFRSRVICSLECQFRPPVPPECGNNPKLQPRCAP